jgi:hypothetical protein
VLHRIEDADTHLDEVGERTDGATVMVEDGDAELARQIDAVLQARTVEGAEGSARSTAPPGCRGRSPASPRWPAAGLEGRGKTAASVMRSADGG